MKSFRFYREPPVASPVRVVSDYSAEDRLRMLATFSSAAADYRRRGHVSSCVLGGFTGSILLAMVLQNSLSPWFMTSAMLLWLIGVGTSLIAPRLVCPGCFNNVDHSLGAYCPECGSRQLQLGNWFRAAYCTACRKSLRRHKGRHYRIRACTHCGLLLDEKGL